MNVNKEKQLQKQYKRLDKFEIEIYEYANEEAKKLIESIKKNQGYEIVSDQDGKIAFKRNV